MKLNQNDCFYMNGINQDYCRYSIRGLKVLSFFAAIKNDNILWISNNRFNGLFTLDLITKEIQFKGCFLGSNKEAKCIHKHAIRYHESLFFFPLFSSGIDEYNLNTGIFEFYELEKEVSLVKVNSVIVEGEEVFIFSETVDCPIYIFNMKTKEIKRDYSLRNLSEKNNLGKEIISDLCRVENDIFIIINGGKIVFRYNIRLFASNIIVLNEDICISKAAWDGYNFWIYDYKQGMLIKWNSEEKERYSLHELLKCNVPILRIIALGKYIIFWTINGMLYKYNVLENSLTEIDMLYDTDYVISDFLEDWNVACFSGFVIEENKMIAFPLRGNKLLQIDFNTDRVKSWNLETNYLPALQYNMRETKGTTLKTFLEITSRSGENAKKVNSQSVGKDIYRRVL